MVFIISGLKYDTDKMEEIARVKKWYETSNALLAMMASSEKLGMMYFCTLWKSKKGNWLLTHVQDGKNIGDAISEDEAKELLMRYATTKYEEMFEEIPEA